MCGRYVLSQPGDVLDETLESLAGFELSGDRPEVSPRFNVAPTQKMPIVFAADSSLGGPQRDRVRVRSARWEFRRAKGRTKAPAGSTLINARAETLEDRPSFRESFHHRRCLVPATGFYEWRPKGNRQPFFFQASASSAGRTGLCFAGLWQEAAYGASSEGTQDVGFCIVTGKAGPAMAEIHHRRPIILEPTNYAAWLDPNQPVDRLFDLLRTNDPPLDRHPVSFDVNRVVNDAQSLVKPVREAPTNLSLF